MSYRRKAETVEAFQMTRTRRRDNSEWPAWLHEAWNKTERQKGSVWPARDSDDRVALGSPLGAMLVFWDDWIVRHANGDLYNCSTETFELTYEAA